MSPACMYITLSWLLPIFYFTVFVCHRIAKTSSLTKKRRKESIIKLKLFLSPCGNSRGKGDSKQNHRYYDDFLKSSSFSVIFVSLSQLFCSLLYMS